MPGYGVFLHVDLLEAMPGGGALIGDHAVTYWLDEPVKTVMVVDLRPTDK